MGSEASSKLCPTQLIVRVKEWLPSVETHLVPQGHSNRGALPWPLFQTKQLVSSRTTGLYIGSFLKLLKLYQIIYLTILSGNIHILCSLKMYLNLQISVFTYHCMRVTKTALEYGSPILLARTQMTASFCCS